MRYGIRNSRFWMALGWFALNALVGCRSVEVVEVNVAYPLATVHVAAKFEVDEEDAQPKVADAAPAKPSHSVQIANKQHSATFIVK